jgi:hypothetical protein
MSTERDKRRRPVVAPFGLVFVSCKPVLSYMLGQRLKEKPTLKTDNSRLLDSLSEMNAVVSQLLLTDSTERHRNERSPNGIDMQFDMKSADPAQGFTPSTTNQNGTVCAAVVGDSFGVSGQAWGLPQLHPFPSAFRLGSPHALFRLTPQFSRVE